MQKRNIIYWITYFIFILFFVLGALFYRQAFLAVLILLFLIMPIISIALLKIWGSKIQIDIAGHTAYVTAGNKIFLDIEVTNRSIFPFLNCELFFNYENLFYPDKMNNIISLPAESRKTKRFVLSFDTSYAGMAEFHFNSMTVTDFLHLYTIRLYADKTVSIPVYPVQMPFDEKFVVPESYAGAEDETIVMYGFPSQDIKEIREYLPGDSLKNIHWKMSAKSDELVVKELEQASSRTLLLLPELTKDNLQDTISTLYSFSKSLIGKREVFKIVLFNALTSEFTEYRIESLENLEDSFLALFYLKPYEMKRFALESFKGLFGDEINVIHILGKEVQIR